MGHRFTISGHIQEPYYAPGDDEHLRMLSRENARIIWTLSREAPWFSRQFFARSAPEIHLRSKITTTYRGRVIHFGGSFSSLFNEWAAWRSSFESLLRSMYWEHAVVSMVTEGGGRHHYYWKATLEALKAMGRKPPSPVSEWTFEASPNAL